MKRLLALVAVLALGVSAFAGIKLYPGITFAGAAVPYISVETTIADTGSVKFLTSGEDFITVFRAWPSGRIMWPAEDGTDETSLPVFFGLGAAMEIVNGGEFETVFYAEAGVLLYNMVELGFAIRNGTGAHNMSLNLGLSFALEF